MQEMEVTKCRICGTLFKRPAIEFRVYTNYDPTCCRGCNSLAEANTAIPAK